MYMKMLAEAACPGPVPSIPHHLQFDSLGHTEFYFTEEIEVTGVKCPQSHRRKWWSQGLPASVPPSLTGSLFITAPIPKESSAES